MTIRESSILSRLLTRMFSMCIHFQANRVSMPRINMTKQGYKKLAIARPLPDWFSCRVTRRGGNSKYLINVLSRFLQFFVVFIYRVSSTLRYFVSIIKCTRFHHVRVRGRVSARMNQLWHCGRPTKTMSFLSTLLCFNIALRL